MTKTICNIDTICILVNIENYEKSAKNVLDMLSNEKNKFTNENYKNVLTIKDISFELLPNGCKGYAYILKNAGYEIKVSQYCPKIATFSPIQVRISSEYLWSYGAEQSWQIISSWITNTFGKIISNKVCRLDLCCHTSNIDFITNYENCYKGHFKKFDKTFHSGKSINCITFGTRKGKNVFCRIYNKTLEVKETKKKYWFFDIWERYGLDIENVWNLEFELKSEFLRSFNLVTIEDCLIAIPQIWFYCTSEWLVKIEKTNNRIDRCPVNSEWAKLQKCFTQMDKCSLIERQKQISLDADALIPNIIGNITSYCARTKDTDSKKAFSKLFLSAEKYLSNKNTTFEEEVLKKSKILNETRRDNLGK